MLRVLMSSLLCCKISTIISQCTIVNTYFLCFLCFISVYLGRARLRQYTLHLIAAKADGTMWFLQPIALTPKHEDVIYVSRGKILKIVFSENCQFMAYYDENKTVCLLQYSAEDARWEIAGKTRAHYKRIYAMLFTKTYPPRLFTLGEDRVLVEYDLEHINYETLQVKSTDRIEQLAIPLTFMEYPSKDENSPIYFLYSDNQFKYKMLHITTKMCRSVALGPAYGCYANSCINKIQLLPGHNDQYLIYANNCAIGVQELPADGNPYRYIGLIGHPARLLDFRTSHDGDYLFTYGEGDRCVLMWKINVRAIEVLKSIGGIDLEPFYCLIEGGINGWLFKEMQDLFYYMQILYQGEDTVLPRKVSDMIPVSELPDLMRACGFYPSEYEIETMVVDVRYKHFNETGNLTEEVSFSDFIKLYVNHRPAHGLSLESLQKKFATFCKAGEASTNDNSCLSNRSFVNVLCERGEPFTSSKARTCLTTLMQVVDSKEQDETDEDFSFLPKVIDFQVFIDDVLGMDLARHTIEETVQVDTNTESEHQC